MQYNLRRHAAKGSKPHSESANYVNLPDWRAFCGCANLMIPLFIPRSLHNCCRNPRFLTLALAATACQPVATGSTSCSTTKGFGKDIEKTGEKVENAASH